MSPTLDRDGLSGDLYISVPNGIEYLANGHNHEKRTSFNIFAMNETILALAFKHGISFNNVKNSSKVSMIDILNNGNFDPQRIYLYSSKDNLDIYCDINHHIVQEIICKYHNAIALLIEGKSLFET